MFSPVYTSPVTVSELQRAGVQSSSGNPHGMGQTYPHGIGQTHPMTTMATLNAATPNQNNQISTNPQVLIPVNAQPLQLHPAMTTLERGDAIYQHAQASQPKHPRQIIDTSNRQNPVNPLTHGTRIYFVRHCSLGCKDSRINFDIYFAHSHSVEEGHWIKGETWWLNTPNEVTIHEHPLSEIEVRELSGLEIAEYISAIEDCPARQLILQDDNDLGWLSRGWITEVGIWAFDKRRQHSLMDLKDEFARRVGLGTGSPVGWPLAGQQGIAPGPRLPRTAQSSTAVPPFRANSIAQGAEPHNGRPAIVTPSIDLGDYILDEEEDPDEIFAAEVEALAESGL